jgi:hypothetical protein
MNLPSSALNKERSLSAGAQTPSELTWEFDEAADQIPG